MKRYDEAIVSFNRAIEIEPMYTKAYTNRGVCFYEMKKFVQALENFKQTLQIEPNDVNALSNLNVCLKQLNDKEKAREVDEYLKMGAQLFEKKHFTKAIKLFDQVIELDARNVKALNAKGFRFK